jgi:hypothetical protein
LELTLTGITKLPLFVIPESLQSRRDLTTLKSLAFSSFLTFGTLGTAVV